MKSQRRHELQKNTLDAELTRLKSLYRKHGTKLSWGLVIAAAVVLALVFWNRRVEQRQADVQYQYDQVQQFSAQPGTNREDILNRLRELSLQDDVEWVAADASLALGRMYAVQSLIAPTAEERRRAADAARSAYTRVVETFDTFPVPVAGAQLGLGKLEEGRGDVEAARKRYQLVLEMKPLDGYPVKTLAEDALRRLHDMGAPVRLATTLPAWLEAKRKAEAEKAKDAAAPTTESPEG